MGTRKDIEKIALGDLHISGHIDMQITNPLTGRPYYKFVDHNLVMDGLYKYLKVLCIASLCSYNGGPYTRRPITSIAGAPSTAPYSGSSYNRAFSCQVGSTSESGDIQYPPASTSGARLTCPIDQILLTDGTSQPSAADVAVDGNIVAMADMCTVATSGTNKGIFSFSRSFESFTKLYRRWDWASTNGNGTISKIMLCQTYPVLRDFDFTKSISSCTTASIDGCNIYMNGYMFYAKYSNDTVTLQIRKVDTNTPRLIDICTLNLTDNGLDTKPRYHFMSVAFIDDTTVYIVPNACTDVYKMLVYTVDLATGTITQIREMYGSSSASSTTPYQLAYNNAYHNYNPQIYKDTDGNVVVLTYQYKYTLPSTGGQLTFLSNIYSADREVQSCLYSYMYVPSNITSELVFDGNIVKRLYGDSLYTLDLSTGKYSAVQTKDIYINYGALSSNYCLFIIAGINGEPFDLSGPYKLITISTTSSLPFIQVDTLLSSNYTKVMTQRLLPESIEKNDMPMYVGYTLEFE